jgi:RES domain-containing protein
MRVWRLTRLPYADLSGAGAERLGGRWTSPRIPVVYAATDAALAALEVRANLDLDFTLLPDDYVLLGIDTNYLGYEDAPPPPGGRSC